MGASARRAWLLVLVAGPCAACGDRTAPASLDATLIVERTLLTCASPEPVTSCTITTQLKVSVRETAGQEVSLQSMEGSLWDTRGMQDMHAAPSMLSAEDIRNAAGTTQVPGNGSRDVPYALGFTIPQPYILGPLRASVRVQGVGGDGHVVEATSEAVLVAPVR
jgi:hypothetical protein